MAHKEPQKCFLSHAWTLLPCGASGTVITPSCCRSEILGKPLSAVATRHPPEGRDAPVISSDPFLTPEEILEPTHGLLGSHGTLGQNT